jgi:hypothetical protein
MAMRDCILYHSTLVEITWVRQNRPSAQTLAAAEAALRECLVAGGANEAEVYAAESFMVFAGHYQHFGQCLRQVSIEFKVGWYAGD